MKEATGELNMTVIVVLAIAAVSVLFMTVIFPMIEGLIKNSTCEAYGSDYKYSTTEQSGKTCIPVESEASESGGTTTTGYCCG